MERKVALEPLDHLDLKASLDREEVLVLMEALDLQDPKELRYVYKENIFSMMLKMLIY